MTSTYWKIEPDWRFSERRIIVLAFEDLPEAVQQYMEEIWGFRRGLCFWYHNDGGDDYMPAAVRLFNKKLKERFPDHEMILIEMD
jgi:hypothetical protein